MSSVTRSIVNDSTPEGNEPTMSYLSDLEIEYGDDGEIEVEIENQEERAQRHERAQELLQDIDPSRVLDVLGR